MNNRGVWLWNNLRKYIEVSQKTIRTYEDKAFLDEFTAEERDILDQMITGKDSQKRVGEFLDKWASEILGEFAIPPTDL